MRKIKASCKNIYKKLKVYGKPKIFCVGLNKTGTTSLEKEMISLGYTVGNQMRGTRLINNWAKRDFKPIIQLGKTAQFFQDAPFSYPYTYIAMDMAYPNSKFILTVRDNPEEWYNSLTRFHSKLWGDGNTPPTAEDLKRAPGPWPESRYEIRMKVNNVTENEPYNKDVLVDFYNTHNKNVKEYFRHRPDDLLVLNLKEKESYARFCQFLGIEQKKTFFPLENKTSEI